MYVYNTHPSLSPSLPYIPVATRAVNVGSTLRRGCTVRAVSPMAAERYRPG